MKKAPETGASVGTFACPSSGLGQLLLLFGRCFFLRGSFLGCALHRLILPKHQILRLKNRNVIHI